MKVRDASVGGGGGGAVNMVMDPENSDLFDLVWDGPGVTFSSSESIESNICVFYGALLTLTVQHQCHGYLHPM